MPLLHISTGHIKVCNTLQTHKEKRYITDKNTTAYVKVEDLEGILESLMKKAMLYKHKDDEDMVEEMDRLYNSTVQEAEKRESAMQGRDG